MRKPEARTARKPESRHRKPSPRPAGVSGARPPAPPREDQGGLPARELAVSLVEAVLVRRRTLDDALAGIGADVRYRDLAPRDRAFARLVASTALRHHKLLETVLATFIARPLPRDAHRARMILLCASAQLLLLGTPPHAAIYLAVDQCRADRNAQAYAKLTNAVLRRVAEQGPSIIAGLDRVRSAMPDWLMARWTRAWGADLARRVAEASLGEAALDLSVKRDAEGWAQRLGGVVLPSGSVRLAEHGAVEELPGFTEGEWWVQDAAAALPAALLGDVAGRRVADLCAAPGGKTAQLACRGARVTAVDQSAQRLRRLATNLARLGLTDSVEVITGDVLDWRPVERFEAILLDAPCTATGTLRRHPDILALKGEADVARMARLQGLMLERAIAMLAPGGTLVYCTCSLEREEGDEQIARLLTARSDVRRRPIEASEVGGVADWVTREGDLRTLPCQTALDPPYRSGMDGFFAARLVLNA